MKGLSFITQFKIEFLLLFIGCRKVFGHVHWKRQVSEGFVTFYTYYKIIQHWTMGTILSPAIYTFVMLKYYTWIIL